MTESNKKFLIDFATLREMFANIALAMLFLLFALSNLNSYVQHPRLSPLLAIALETITAVLFLFRAKPSRVSFSAYSWIATLGGTFGTLMLRPSSATSDILAGQILQVAGYSLAILALLSLWRSFGMLPAERGVRSHGAYRLVRHPIYAAYLIHHFGYLISNFTVYNIVVVIVTNVFQVLRIFDEERFLSASAEYREYKTRTRWRIIPLVF